MKKIIIRIFQVLLIGALFIFEELTKTRALVMRHVYTKKAMHLKFLTIPLKSALSLVLLLVAFFIVKKTGKVFSTMIVTVATLLYMWLPLFNSLAIYTYGLAVILLVYILEMIYSLITIPKE